MFWLNNNNNNDNSWWKQEKDNIKLAASLKR